LLFLLLALSACVTSDAKEQRREGTREATRGAILGDVQATSIAERFRQPTLTPAPTWTPAAGLSSLVLASRVNPDGSPQDELRSVSGFGGATVYACARISNVQAGQTVIAVWSTIDGNEVGRSDEKLDAGASQRWVALPWQIGGGLPGGTYAVAIYIDKVDLEHQLNSLVFRVG
jgi:hypothetical protein